MFIIIFSVVNDILNKFLDINIWATILDKTDIYLLEIYHSGEMQKMLTRFHEFADWIVKEENYDMLGIDL